MLPLMSRLLILALLLVFIVRCWSSLMSRHRRRAVGARPSVPMQRTSSPLPSPAAEPTVEPTVESVVEPAAGPVGQPRRTEDVVRGAVTSTARSVPDSQPDVPAQARLDDDLSARVRSLMDSGYETGAVRLLCDELDIGIVAARQVARSLAGLPSI
jgi:hypothetical protein